MSSVHDTKMIEYTENKRSASMMKTVASISVALRNAGFISETIIHRYQEYATTLRRDCYGPRLWEPNENHRNFAAKGRINSPTTF